MNYRIGDIVLFQSSINLTSFTNVPIRVGKIISTPYVDDVRQPLSTYIIETSDNTYDCNDPIALASKFFIKLYNIK